MTTEQFFTNVAAHLLQNYKPGDHARAIFEKFAKEEFKWKEVKSKRFAKEVDLGKSVEGINTKGLKRFFLWYFLNYMKDIALVESSDNSSKQGRSAQS